MALFDLPVFEPIRRSVIALFGGAIVFQPIEKSLSFELMPNMSYGFTERHRENLDWLFMASAAESDSEFEDFIGFDEEEIPTKAIHFPI